MALSKASPRAARLSGALSFWALSALPALALAQARGGKKLMLFVLAGPMVIPLVGVLLAAGLLRLTRASFVWWLLCALLSLNSALLGGLDAIVQGEVARVLSLCAQLAFAGVMLFTVSKHEHEAKAKIVFGRVPSVLACALLPGVVTYLLFR